MKSLTIVEPHADGHRMQYVRRIIRHAIQSGLHVRLLTMPEAVNHPAFKMVHEELGNEFDTVVLSPKRLADKLIGRGNYYGRQLGYYLAFADYFRKLPPTSRPDFVLVPYLDTCDKVTGLLGSPFKGIPWAGLGMHYRFHYQAMGAVQATSRADRFKERMFVRLVQNRSLTIFFTIDELLYEHVVLRYPNLAAKIRYVADPVDMIGDTPRSVARSRFNILEDRPVLLVYGALALRKGVEELLAATQEPQFPADAVLLFAGKQDNAVVDLLTGPIAQTLRAQDRLIEANGFLDDTDEYNAFRAADVVWVGYKDWHGMSGVMIQAGKMGLPVIACEAGLIGQMTKKYQLGLLVDVHAIDQIAAAFHTLVSDVALAQEYGQHGRDLAAKHTSYAFGEAIIEGIRTASSSE